MTDIDRKARTREYKETPRPAGVYRVRNTTRERSLVGSSVNLPGILNRQRFQLTSGLHADRELQLDWNEHGPDAFVFEVLDELEPQKEPDYDPTEDLAVLLAMWIDKLTPPANRCMSGRVNAPGSEHLPGFHDGAGRQ